MALTDKQKEEMLAEVFDTQKINVKCGRHLYFGPVKGKPEIVPEMGCSDCWKVFFICEMASTPPDERRQKLDEIEEVLNHMVEMIIAGTWDLKLYPHAKVEFETED
jgi:hypothetical protein